MHGDEAPRRRRTDHDYITFREAVDMFATKDAILLLTGSIEKLDIKLDKVLADKVPGWFWLVVGPIGAVILAHYLPGK